MELDQLIGCPLTLGVLNPHTGLNPSLRNGPNCYKANRLAQEVDIVRGVEKEMQAGDGFRVLSPTQPIRPRSTHPPVGPLRCGRSVKGASWRAGVGG
ncbi:MAG: hypothetical protein NTNFB02_00160 [Nitrospira sp.]